MRIFKFFTTNITAKILALVFAIGVWTYVATGQTKVDRFPGRIPIEAKNIPSGMAIADDLGSVEIKIKAPYSSWQRLSADDFTANVDLSGLDVGTYRMDVNVSVSNSAVSVVEKNPSKVTIRLEPLVTKKVPVAIKLDGKPADGFAAGEAVTTPDQVEVRGAKSLVDSILNAQATLGLNGENSDFEKKVKLSAFDAASQEIKSVSFAPDTVIVKVPVMRATNTKTVGIKAIITGDPSENFWVSKVIVTPSVAVITGEPEVLKNIEYLETTRVDINNISKNKSLDADLILPEGIALLSNQNKVKVTVYVSPNLSIKELPATFNFIGRSASASSNVKVRLAGPIIMLNNLTSRDIILNIDMSSRSSGAFVINKNDFSVPSGIDVIDFSPKTININVE